MRHARTRWSTHFAACCAFALLGPQGLASQFVGNHLFVSDPGNQVIRELDADGAIVRLLGGSTLVLPQRLTFGPDGNLYVLDDHGGFSSTDHLVVLSMHIPLRCYLAPDDPADTTADYRDLLRLLKGRRHSVSFAGHLHATEHHYLSLGGGTAVHHHHVLTAGSGSWWSGPRDARGVDAGDHAVPPGCRLSRR